VAYAPWLTDELIDKCFRLAWFIFPDKPVALSIVIWALARLDVAVAIQDKRLKHAGRARNKVLLHELHLLQRLIFHGAEPPERRHEQLNQPAAPTQRDMVIRWFECLIRIASDNSFYVSVAKCRLLHNYSTFETRNLYELVLQDPGRGKDDDQYRRIKSRFCHKLLHRFHNLIHRGADGPRGEVRFRSLETPRAYLPLAEQCQRLFAPWGAHAPQFPPDFRPDRDEIPSLRFDGHQPDEEAHVEACRMFTLIHPDSFSLLACSLRLAPPEQRLTIPHFSLAMTQDPDNENRATSTGDRAEPPGLDPRERQSIHDILQEYEDARESLVPGSLVVFVDHDLRATLDLATATVLKLPIQPSDEFIEVCTSRDNHPIPLAALRLFRDEADRTRPGLFAVELPAGRQLTLEVEGGANPEITLSWQQPQPLASSVSDLRRSIASRRQRLADAWDALLPSSPSLSEPALVHRIRLAEQSDPGRAVALHATTRLCPQCGGLLSRSPTGDPAGRRYLWKCDRCPFLCIENLREAPADSA